MEHRRPQRTGKLPGKVETEWCGLRMTLQLPASLYPIRFIYKFHPSMFGLCRISFLAGVVVCFFATSIPQTACQEMARTTMAHLDIIREGSPLVGTAGLQGHCSCAKKNLNPPRK
jgi:hypothetical protein